MSRAQEFPSPLALGRPPWQHRRVVLAAAIASSRFRGCVTAVLVAAGIERGMCAVEHIFAVLAAAPAAVTAAAAAPAPAMHHRAAHECNWLFKSRLRYCQREELEGNTGLTCSNQDSAISFKDDGGG